MLCLDEIETTFRARLLVGDGPMSFHPGTMHNDTEHLDLEASFLLACAIEAEAHLKQGTAEQISELDRH